MTSNTSAAADARLKQVNELRWQKFSVLDDGFVCLVDVMGDDSSIVQARSGELRRGHQKGQRRSHVDPLPS